MSHSDEVDPYRRDEFWIKEMDRVLKNKYISPEYRKRCRKLRAACEKRIGKIGKIVNGHYPHERK